MATKTFLFVDQVGSTEQLTRLGDAAAQQVRQALFDLLRQATDVAGGQEVDFTGDGLFCAFDGAAAAVDAAVSMQQLVWSFDARRSQPHRIAIRCGLNSGEPLESEGGGYFGAAVVVAARLCAVSLPGQVLVSSLVRGLVEPRGLHVFQSVGSLELKGVPVPVEAAAVLWEPDTRRAPVPGLLAIDRTTPFLGRRRELDAVDAAWERVCRGERQLVAISGDRGAGVTRLAAEVAGRLHDRGASVWAGAGHGPDERLSPWAEAIGAWAGAVPRAELRLAMGSRAGDLRRLVPALVDLVPRLAAPEPVEASAQLVLIADAIDVLATRWSEVEPLVVVLDELEDADPGSLTVLRRLATSRRGGRILLVVGYEPSSVGTPRLRAALQEARPDVDLALGGLAEDDVRALVEAVTGGPVDAGSLRAVVAETEGSPYFVLELARALRERRLARQVQQAVGRAGELRTDLRLRREEITVALRELGELRERGSDRGTPRLDAEGTPPAEGASPYRGLLAFGTEDADSFAGRDALVAEMVAALVSSRWLAVVGPSGAGKSSAIRAGLVPALARGAAPGSESWTVGVCTPGPDPLAALAAAVSGGALTAEGTKRLQHEPLAAIAGELAGDGRTVLVVDQFEELWTTAPEAARRRALDLLVEAATGDDERVLVVVSLRADHYGHVAESPMLADLVAGSQVVVGPMSTAELRAAVEVPAQRGGWVLEPGLAQAVIDDVEGEAGALPLLSTAMLQTWERRRGRSLTRSGYAESGGARRAIASLADATLAELEPGDRDVARRLLLRLAAPTAEGTDVARPARLSELVVDEPTRRVLGRLAERRLVVVGTSTAQVAHEALLREWPQLRRWLEADRDGRRLHQQIATAATDWGAADRDDGALLRGARLAAAADWRAEHEPDLTGSEREYLDESAAARDRDLRRARRTSRRFQVLAAVLVVLLIGAAVATGFAVVRGRDARAGANEATARGLAAQAVAVAGTRIDTALLLAVEGYRRAPSIDTEGGLLSALNAARFLTGYQKELPSDPFDAELSPDGTTLAVLTSSGDIQLFDTATWRPRGSPLVRGIPGPLYVGFDPDGKTLSYSDEAGGHLVDVATGEPVGPALGDVGPSTRVFFSSDGTVIALDGWEAANTIRLVDRATGTVLGVIPVALGGVRPGATEVAAMVAAPGPGLQRFRFDGTPIGSPVPVPVAAGCCPTVRYTPDGRRLLVTGPDAVTLILDANTLAPVGQPVGSSGGSIRDASFTPDGQMVALAQDDGSITVAGTLDGVVRARVAGLGQGAVVAFLDDHRLLTLTPGGSAEYDLDRVTQVGRPTVLPHTIAQMVVEPARDRALIGQGSELVAVDPGGRLQPTGLTMPVELEGPMALSPDGRRMAVQGAPPGLNFDDPPPDAADSELVVADRASGEVLVRTTVTGDENDASVEGRLAFSPDGRRLAAGTWGGVLTILDIATGKVVAERKVGPSAIRGLLWSPDGKVIYEGDQGGVLRFLDPRTAVQVAEVRITPGINVNDIVAVPGTGLLAVVSEAGQVFFVAPRSRALVGDPLVAEATALRRAATSPDGERIAAVSLDGALRLWDRSSGRAIGPPLEAYSSYTRGIAWLTRTQLLTGSWNGGFVAWDLSPSSWVRRACELAGRDLTRAEWQRYLPDQPYRRTCG